MGSFNVQKNAKNSDLVEDTSFNKKDEPIKKGIKINNKFHINKKLIIIIIVIISIVFFLLSIVNLILAFNKNNDSNNNVNNYENAIPNIKEQLIIKYHVKIHVDFEENIMFSKYDVILSTDGQSKTLKHGKKTDVEFILEEGKHTLTFTSDDEYPISEEKEINVTSNMEISYKINSHYDKISISKVYLDRDEDLINKVKIEKDEKSYIGKNYQDVINDLKKLGFTNIKEKYKYDVNETSKNKEGEVYGVKINNSTKYKKGDTFKNDVKVVVTYHVNENEDPTRISVPYDSDSAAGKKYEDVVRAFKDAGFTNVTTNRAITHNTTNYDGLVSKITVDDKKIDKNKKYKKDANIEISYVRYEPKREEVELSHYGAKKAFEAYGKAIYRYGFKVHWIVGLIDAKDRDDGSVYYKVEVTITNQYGAKYDAIAEGVVSGSDANPKVSQFKVS